MTAWTQQGLRLDIALAVALEVAVLNLRRAECQAARTNALHFNQRLWRVAAALAPTAPLAEDRTGLADAARMVESARLTIDDLAALNVEFARTLAGRAATGGALRQILGDWRNARGSSEVEFGPWLVARLEGMTAPVARPLAA